ncbi:MAG: hypothetical protein ABIN91_21795 [Mucilaginibacter sp.]
MVHRKKNGELISMDIQLAPFRFKGVRTSIDVATDITERLNYIKAIEHQKHNGGNQHRACQIVTKHIIQHVYNHYRTIR